MDSVDAVANDGTSHSPKQLSIRSAPIAMSAAIKFDIPNDCRDFFPFAGLPIELRHQIWEEALATPGMQFLKIQHADPSYLTRWWTKSMPALPPPSDSSDDEEEDPVLLETRNEVRPTETIHASLVPLYPTPQADISYYTILNQELTKLSVTCNESASVIKRLMARPTTLTLNSGRMISLDVNSDIVYLEYVPPAVFEDSFRFTKGLRCVGLEKITKVAVRYCHKWHKDESPTRCPICGQNHSNSDRVAYPSHLYQFIAQYLPNLKHFYFVDYFILRKPANDTQECSKVISASIKQASGKRSLGKFEGGNRTYYEVDHQDWTVKSSVFETMSWLQDRFVSYAKASKLATHKNPEGVKFGVLACEWSVGRPLEMKKAQTTPVKKGRNKRAFCGEHTTRRNRRSPSIVTSAPAAENGSFEVGDGFPFVFGVAGRNDFEFTFEMARR